MPHSRHRHKHGHKTTGPGPKSIKKGRNAAAILAVLMALFGFAIAFLSVGNEPVWLMGGAAAGMIAGFLLGRFIDKSAGR